MIVLGVDPGLCHPAFVLIDEKLKIIDSCVYEIKDKGEKRKRKILLKLIEVLNNYKIDLIVLEGYSYMSTRNMKSLLETAESTGLLKYWIAKQNIPLLIIPPTQWKKYALGKGNVKKDMIPKQAYKIFKVDFNSADEVDAFCIATVGVGFLKKKNLKSYQEEVVKKLSLA